jgi:hypothetical protein
LSSDRAWNVAFAVLMAGLLALVLATYRSYGMTADEVEGAIYGQRIIRFYAGLDAAAQVERRGNTHLYGGLFEALCAASSWFLTGEACSVEGRRLFPSCTGRVLSGPGNLRWRLP